MRPCFGECKSAKTKEHWVESIPSPFSMVPYIVIHDADVCERKE